MADELDLYRSRKYLDHLKELELANQTLRVPTMPVWPQPPAPPRLSDYPTNDLIMEVIARGFRVDLAPDHER